MAKRMYSFEKKDMLINEWGELVLIAIGKDSK